MAHFEHGALDRTTHRLVDPGTALKRIWYECPDCHRDVNVRSGPVRAAYFAHRPDRLNPCTYYNHNPSADQRHKNAQLKLKQFLERGKEIDIGRLCPCGCRWVTKRGISCLPSNIVKCEHRFKFNDSNKSADVAVLDSSGNIVWIFEVVHTHYTQEADRPEPWYEIRADEINAIPSDSDNVFLACMRQVVRPECLAKQEAEHQALLKREEEARARWEFERPQREEEERKRNEYHAEMARRWETKQKLLRDEERERRLQFEEQNRKRMEEERLARLRTREQQVAYENREKAEKKAQQQQFKVLYRKYASRVPKCDLCTSNKLTAWITVDPWVGRCRRCETAIDTLVHQKMNSSSQNPPVSSK